LVRRGSTESRRGSTVGRRGSTVSRSSLTVVGSMFRLKVHRREIFERAFDMINLQLSLLFLAAGINITLDSVI